MKFRNTMISRITRNNFEISLEQQFFFSIFPIILLGNPGPSLFFAHPSSSSCFHARRLLTKWRRMRQGEKEEREGRSKKTERERGGGTEIKKKNKKIRRKAKYLPMLAGENWTVFVTEYFYLTPQHFSFFTFICSIGEFKVRNLTRQCSSVAMSRGGSSTWTASTGEKPVCEMRQ